jgi:error-prone DNA polymerase
MGFIHIAHLETEAGRAIYDLRFTICDSRKTERPYKDLEDFIARVPATLDQLIILIRAGAFRFTGKPKGLLLWEAHMLLGKNQPSSVNRPIADQVLFHTKVQKFEMPLLEQNFLSDVYDEIELLGFPVTHTYFDLLKTRFRGDILADQMANHAGKSVRMLGLLVTIKYVRTIRREWMHFGTFIDVNGHFFDTVHFPKAVTDYPFRGDGVYLVKGKIVEEFGFPSMHVEKMAKMPLQNDPRG